MLDFSTLSRKRESAVVRAMGEKRRRLDRLERDYRQALAEVENGHRGAVEQEDRRCAEEITHIGYEFGRRAAWALLADLERTYTLLNERSLVLAITDDDRQKAQTVGQVLAGLAGEADRAKVEGIVGILSPGVKAALSLGSMENKGVISYVAEARDACWLLTPVGEHGDKPELACRLERKIDDVLDVGETTFGAQVQVQNGDVVKASAGRIKFDAVGEAAQGFLVYKLVPKGASVPNELVAAISDKFAKLQPDGFPQALLAHRVMQVDSLAAEYFMKHSRSELYSPQDAIEELGDVDAVPVSTVAEILCTRQPQVKRLATMGKLVLDEHGDVTLESLRQYAKANPVGYEPATDANRAVRPARMPVQAKLSGSTGRKRSHIMSEYAYTAADAEGRRAEALARLAELEDRGSLTSRDVAYVLGITNLTSVQRWASPLGARKEGWAFIYPRSEVERVVRGYRPTGSGWQRPRA